MKDNVDLIVKAVCTIIDHFFSRREQHVDIVVAKGNANINKVFNDVLEHGPAYIEKVQKMLETSFETMEKGDMPKPEVADEELPN